MRLCVAAPSSGNWPKRMTHEVLDQKLHFPHMEGRFVFKHAVTRMPEVLMETLGAASLKVEDIDLFLFHQANLRINEFVAAKLEIPADKLFNNIMRYGNCSAASIPMLMHETQANGMLAPGKLVNMTAFGAGFSWASAVVRW
jgi:3-oxoacyl-[acyl-carrier-protein] synthase-3